MRFDKTEISLAAIAIACVLFGFVSPGWLIFLLTIAFAKALVVHINHATHFVEGEWLDRNCWRVASVHVLRGWNF